MRRVAMWRSHRHAPLTMMLSRYGFDLRPRPLKYRIICMYVPLRADTSITEVAMIAMAVKMNDSPKVLAAAALTFVSHINME